MNSSSLFVPLHIQSKYSLFSSIIDIGSLVDKICAMGLPAVAITDRASLAGVGELFEKANRKGVKPIVGYECPVTPFAGVNTIGDRNDRHFHIVLLAQNHSGYLNLCRLNRKVHEQRNMPRELSIDLIARHKEGLIVLSGGTSGEVNWLLRKNNYTAARSITQAFIALFGKNHFYLEIERYKGVKRNAGSRGIVNLAHDLCVELVAASNCCYLNLNDAGLFDIFKAINQRGDQNGYVKRNFHLASPVEMARLFEDIPEALRNTLHIANRCNLDFQFSTCRYPGLSHKPGADLWDIEKEAKSGLKSYIKKHKEKWPLSKWKMYLRRLANEIKVIKHLTLEGFFLMAADVVEYAAEQHIPIGPGRSSVCASLVAYCLGLTKVDPVANGLPFERYINSNHRRFPDIQIDVSDKHREAVMRHFISIYGTDGRVASINTFQTACPKQFVRTVAIYLGFDSDSVNRLIEFVPEFVSSAKDLIWHLEKSAIPAQNKSIFMDLICACSRLYALPTGTQPHKTGFVVAKDPVAKIVPVIDDFGTIPRCQLNAAGVKHLGLARIYFIPLPELDMLQAVIDRIRITVPDFHPDNIPETDMETFQLICRQKTDGVFFLNASGMKILTAAIGVSNLTELAGIIALFQPDSLKKDLANKIFLYKDPKIIRFEKSEAVRRILSETWGVLMYWEQILMICNQLAGYSFEEADLLSTILARQNSADIQRAKKCFASRAKAKQIIDEAYALCLFERFETASSYLYSKAHALAYAKIIYQMAYLKTHFQREYNFCLANKLRPTE